MEDQASLEAFPALHEYDKIREANSKEGSTINPLDLCRNGMFRQDEWSDMLQGDTIVSYNAICNYEIENIDLPELDTNHFPVNAPASDTQHGQQSVPALSTLGDPATYGLNGDCFINRPLIHYSPDSPFSKNSSQNPVDSGSTTGGTKRRERNQFPESQWDELRPYIEDLLNKGKKLQDIVDLLKSERQFPISLSTLQRHLRRWNLHKNFPKIPPDVAVHMMEREKQRKVEDGKETRYRFKSQVIPRQRYLNIAIRAANHGAGPIQSSTPPGLSIYTPSDAGSKRKGKQYHFNNGATDQVYATSQSSLRLPLVHCTEMVDKPILDSSDLKERINTHTYFTENLSDELDSMPLADLRVLLQTFPRHEPDAYSSRLLILQSIINRLEDEPDDRKSLSKADLRQSTIEYATLLTELHRNWEARAFLSTIQDELSGWQDEELIQLTKLSLVSHIGGRLLDPKKLEHIGDLGKRLIEMERRIGKTGESHYKVNLIYTYLLRVHSIHKECLSYNELQEIKHSIASQAVDGSHQASHSCIWLSLQYIRWCLVQSKTTIATQIFDHLQHIIVSSGHSENDPSVNLLHKLRGIYLSSGSCENYRCNSIDLFELTDVDELWTTEFEVYLRDQPRLKLAKRSKEDDDALYQ